MSDTITRDDLDLDALEALCADATPGPWAAWAGQGWPAEWADAGFPRDAHVVWPIRREADTRDTPPLAVAARPEDQLFLAAARDVLPEMIAALRAAWTDVESLTQERDRLRVELAVALEAAPDGAPDGLDCRT